jgi:hypothetical protein
VPSQISEVFVKAGPAVTYGALLILIMIFAPSGMVGLITSAYQTLRKRLLGPGEHGTGQMPPDTQTV